MGKMRILSRCFPSVVTAVFEYGEPMEVEAHWIAERPFGVQGAGEYTYTLDFARYDIADDFDKAAGAGCDTSGSLRKASISISIRNAKKGN